MRAIGRALLLATAATAVAGPGAGTAQAATVVQRGDQNLDCGNTHEMIRVNALRTTSRSETCTGPGDSRLTGSHGRASGGLSLGPRLTTAQSGRQNLHCGNSADLLTVNVLGTLEEDTTCVATRGPDGAPHLRRPGAETTSRAGSAAGGLSLGPQLTTAQSGRQNLDCGNSADMLTVNALGTIDRRTTCVAVDRSSGPAHDTPARGKAGAKSGVSVGPQSATAQNGRQNLHCGSRDDLLAVPDLGRATRTTTCTAVDRSATGPRPAP